MVVGDDDDDDGSERRRRRAGESLLRSSVLCHSARALCSDKSAHSDGGLPRVGAVETFSVMGKHLVFRGAEGQESG